MPALMLSTGPVSANPSGGIVVHGDIHIGNGANGFLQINQNSQRAIINWADFSIKQGETTRFVQPGANAAVLNRVTGGDPSAIHGALRANGNVFVINPNGILVGPTGAIDVHGLVLSTLDVDNGEFLAGGDMAFTGSSEAGVVNMGAINAIGGDVFLLGNTVENHGTIRARDGTVGLGAGREILLAAKANPMGERVFVRAGGRGNTGVLNTGSIEGAAVELKAHGNMYALAINNKGSVRAVGAVNQGGKVFLRGIGGAASNTGSIEATAPYGANKSASVLIQAAYARVDGAIRAEGGSVRIAGTDSVKVDGTVDVSSTVGNGGEVIVEANEVALSATSKIDASGATGGGSVRIGGGFQGVDQDVANSRSTSIEGGSVIIADATESGDGGTVLLWSDGDTFFEGDISAQGIGKGGFVEVSGHDDLYFNGTVSTMAADGSTGTLLLDPTNITIASSGGTMTATTLANALNTNSVILNTSQAGDIDRGNVTFNQAVTTWNSANSLSILAHGDIVFNTGVQNQGSGALNAVAGWDGAFGFSGTSPQQNGASIVINDFLNNPSSYGNTPEDSLGNPIGTQGSIFIGSETGTAGVAVGSRNGDTNLLGYNLTMQGSNTATADRYALVGYRDVSSGIDATGNINIHLKNTLTMNAGNGAVRNMAQIGHGGADSSTTTLIGNMSGNIRVAADGGIFMNGGSASAQNYAQIGHGGYNAGTVGSNNSGNISVSALNGSITATGGGATDNYVQIGHGGRLSAGSHNGRVEVLASGDIAFAAGSGGNSYAQIGNGGYDSDRGGVSTNKSGAIGVGSTNGSVLFTAGAGSNSYAQIGHGSTNTTGNLSGSITVRAADDIAFSANNGIGTNAYVQVGHGGYFGTTTAAGSYNGAITMSAGTEGAFSDVFDLDGDGIYGEPIEDAANFDQGGSGAISFTAGGATDRFAQLGHGGRYARGDHSGAIDVQADGSIFFTSGTALQTYAQLGHGGFEADATTGHADNIFVESATGDIAFSAAGSVGASSYAQLGHGGLVANGNNSGNITVRAASGAVEFTGGEATDRYVQLGNGGRSSRGVYGGNIEVLGGAGVSFTAGGVAVVTAESSASLNTAAENGGNGSLVNLANLERSSLVITINDPVQPEYATITSDVNGALTDMNGNPVGTLSTAGVVSFNFQVANTGSSSVTVAYNHANYSRGYAQLGNGGYDADATGAAAGIQSTSGDIKVASTEGNITFTAGLGEINYAQLGNGGYATSGDHTGSIVARAGGDITFVGGSTATTSTGTLASRINTYAQLGNGGMSAAGNHSGTITVSAGTDGNFIDAASAPLDFTRGATGAILFDAGTITDSYAQLGHGGRLARGTHSDDISVTAADTILFLTGTSTRAYVQLGHGGHEAAALGTAAGDLGNSGDIRVQSTEGAIEFRLAATNTSPGGDAYAQLGHGGNLTGGDHTGDIEALAETSLLFRSSSSSGTGSDAYVQLGHGGLESSGNFSGDITAIANTGTTQFRSGASTNTASTAGNNRYAQLGHGGTNSSGAFSGDINLVSEGAITFSNQSSSATIGSYTQLGHGGNNSVSATGHSGDINVVSRSSSIAFTGAAGTSTNSYAQLGHGGANAAGSNSGDITASAGTSMTFTGGSSGIDSYAQLGHGGSNTIGTQFGNVAVRSGSGSISFVGGANSTRSYSQLGHGGYNADALVGEGHGGRIGVAAGSSLLFTAGSGTSQDSYAQLGHGGSGADGNHGQERTVAGESDATYTTATQAGVAFLGNGAITPGSVSISIDPLGAPATVTDDGMGNLVYGSMSVVGSIDYLTGRIEFITDINGGVAEVAAAYAHGRGDIVARASNTLIFTGSTGSDTVIPDPIDPINNPPTVIENRGYAQLGHGGYGSTGDRSGNIAASSQLTADFSDIGDFDGDGVSDAISLTGGATTTNPFSFIAGGSATTASDAYAQLGHGGRLATGTNTGDVSVDAERTVRFEAGGLGARTYAQLGHGGHDAAPVIDASNPIGLANSGDISVESRTGAINLLWAATTTDTSDETYVQLGHGGFVSDPLGSGVNAGGTNEGDITVKAGTSLLLRNTTSANATDSNYVQIGHGGIGWIGDHSGDIAAMATTSVAANGGSGSNSFAQIGHGGTNATGNHSGNIGVAAGTTLAFTAGTGAANQSYAQLGHGGFSASGDHTGNIVVRNGSDFTFTSGTGGTSNYAQLGHGGMMAIGNQFGDITVSSRIAGPFNDIGEFGDITFTPAGSNGLRFLVGTGDGTDTYVQLGHGGRLAAGDHEGDIDVTSERTVNFTGVNGTGARSYVQLGHGGHEAGGNGNTGNISVVANGGGGSVTGSITFASASNAAAGAESYAQLGHGGYLTTGSNTGDINALANNVLSFIATGTAASGYAQLGHGGIGAIGSHSGAITALANTSTMTFTGGIGDDRYAQLGHGGSNAAGDHSGSIAALANGTITFNGGTASVRGYSQLGHGGYNADSILGHSGNIGVASRTGAIAFTAPGGTATETYVQLGHGGFDAAGANNGDIVARAGGDLTFQASTGSGSVSGYAQLGHGGSKAVGTTDPLANLSGFITVSSGLGGTFSDIGDFDRDMVADDIDFTAGGTNGLRFLAGTSGTAPGGADAYAQLGHGGRLNQGAHEGDVAVESGGQILFQAGAVGARTYAQLGHGGHDAAVIGSGSGTAGNSGAITVNAAGNLDFRWGATNTVTSSDTYLQLGHGGFTTDLAAGGDNSGDIQVTANNILFRGTTGATSTSNYLQLGHGGLRWNGNHSGNITVSATGVETANPSRSIAFLGSGSANDRYIQLGHGGRSASGNHGLVDDVTGEAIETIMVTSLGDIVFTGGTGVRGYAMIGNGGHDADLSSNPRGSAANIVVESTSGSILFTGGTGDSSFAQIGNGGYATSGSHRGDLTVAADQSIAFVNAQTGTTANAYVQIGNGGRGAVGDHSGDIEVEAVNGSITFAGGSANDRYAQLGHGGRNARGDHRGNIEVSAGGDISFAAFDGPANTQTVTNTAVLNTLLQDANAANYTMPQTGFLEQTTIVITYQNPAINPLTGQPFSGIIRGDGFGRLFDSDGTQVGTVTAAGVIDLTVTVSDSGAGAPASVLVFDHNNIGLRSYAQLGHGGHDADNPTTLTPGDPGNIGNISVKSENGAIAFIAGGRSENYVQIGHGGYVTNGDHSGNIVVEALGTDGAITFGAGSRINAYAHLGHGGSSAKGNYGLVDVDGDGMADGDITVRSSGSILFNAGNDNQTYAQLGHGGYDADAVTSPGNTSNRGNIVVESLLGDIAFSAAGSSGINAYAQLGHGGYATYGDFSGDIAVRAFDGSIDFIAGEANERYAQLGHGGRSAKGDHQGSLEVSGSSGVTFVGGAVASVSGESNANLVDAAVAGGGATATLANTGNLDLGSVVITINDPSLPEYATLTATATGELLDGNGVQVGTVATDGTVTFDVVVSNAGASGLAVSYDHVNYSRGYAQLGNGGYDSDATGATVGVVGQRGNIDVSSTRGGISFSAGLGFESYAQLGNGGYGTSGDHSGNILVRSAGDVNFMGGTETATATGLLSSRNSNYAQLGHGGMSGTGSHSGTIDVRAIDGAIRFQAGTSADGYAQLGHGGRSGKGDHTGDIFVDAAKEITFAGNSNLRTYAQLGHGGWDADHNNGDSAKVGNSGDILVNTRAGLVTNTGGIYFTAGTGEESYVLLGHGGHATQGVHTGNLLGSNIIDVRANGDIAFISGDGSGFGDDGAAVEGNGRRSWAQLGHGGYDSDAASTGGVDGDGHSADINVSAGGAITFTAKDLINPADPNMLGNDYRNYVQLGHGGLAANGDHRGNISVTAGNGIAFTAGGVDPAATANLSQDAYAQIGHGGYTADGYGGGNVSSKSGDISVVATGGDIVFTGSNTTEAYVQIGHGGRDVDGGNQGDISVSALDGAINFLAGTATDNYAQLGHGGRTARGDHGGDIDVMASGNIVFTGGTGGQAYAMLGHGGRDADNPNPTHYPDNDPLNPLRGPTVDERIGNSGNIGVTSTGGSILFTSGAATEAFVQLGHGGSVTDGDHTGNINVSAAGDIVFDASEAIGNAHYAQLGHGGYLASGGHTGDIVVSADGEIRFIAGTSTSTSSYSYVQIGHGGRNDHRVTRGGSSPNYTQTNANDRYYPGTHNGSIDVTAGNDIVFTGGEGTGAYAQVGHGGFRNAAEAGEGHSGDISVVGGGQIGFSANNGAQAYVQIGHGGYEAFGNHGYQVVRSEMGSVAASQGGTANLSNGSLAAGSVRITVDPTGMGAGTAVFTDDGAGNLLDGGMTVVGTIDYTTGEVTFLNNVNAAGDDVEIAYLHGGSDILVDGGAGVAFAAGSGSTTYAQIGHGGVSSAFSSTLNIDPEESAPATNTSTTTYHLNTPSVDPIGMSGEISVLAGTGMISHAGASLAFSSGSGNDSYAQIGNGGRAARGDHRGDIDVSAAGDISFDAFDGGVASQTATSTTLNSRLQNHTGGTYTMVQTGNLERGTIVITYDNPLPGFTGTIRSDAFGRLFDGATQVGTVSTGGVVTLTETVSDSGAGSANASMTFDHYNTGLRSYVQIGHGGSEADFPTGLTPGDPGNLGNISVTSETGAISFAAGSRTESYAQVGHGGYANSGDHSGNILVEALGTDGAITFAAGSRANAYAQLGHGGSSAKGNNGLVDVDGDSVADGDITVRSAGSILFHAGNDNQTYAQLGHGGYDADAVTTPGNPSNRGSILVESGLGDIIFGAAGSKGINSYAQLGHGGYGTYGDFSGDITVRATAGSVEFIGGEANERYAQLGHGGRSAKGDHRGDIEVLGANGIAFTGGGLASASGETSVALVDAAAAGAGSTATLANTGNLDLGSVVLTIHDPVLPEYAILTTTAAGELLDGNGIQVGAVAANGTVTFDVAVSHGGPSGISASYDHVNYARGYVQLGHGGYDADPSGATAGVSNQQANISVASSSGDITFTAGLGDINYAQLGNGGYATSGDQSGDIVVRAAGHVNFSGGMAVATATGTRASRSNNYAQLGHGGMTAVGNHSGDVTVSSGTDGDFDDVSDSTVSFSGTGNGGVNFTAGTSTDTYAQLGHGGRQARGDHGLVDTDGNAIETISVTSAGDIVFTGGGGARAYAHLGHGGHDADASADLRGSAANIVATSTGGSILFDAVSTGSGDSAYIQLGNGGYATSGNHRGNISVRADQNVTISAAQAGTTANAYAQLGHGGRAAVGDHSGDIDVSAGSGGVSGGVLVRAGTGAADRYAQLGHGGRSATGSHRGDLEVTSLDTIVFQGGTSTRNYVQLGHGGHEAGGLGNVGDIFAQSTAGAIEFRRASTTTSPGTDAYIQMGHGGNLAGGDHLGDITALAETNLLFRNSSSSGTGSDAYVQMGHGGIDATGNFSGDITAVANTGTAQFRSGTSTSTTVGAGSNRYAQLGHGGTNSSGAFSGDISLISEGAITFSNQGSATTIGSYTQLGHGGFNSTSTVGHDGNLTVQSRTSSITFAGVAGGSTDSYAQLGHGGGNATGTHSGDIVVNSGTSITFTGGANGIRGYAQLGHGGHNADALAGEGHSGRIGVGAGTNLAFTAGSGTSQESYAQLGHGGFGADGNHDGDIVARSGNTLIFTGTLGTDTIVDDPIDPINNPQVRIENRGYAQLGHGGYASTGNRGGNITASSQLTGDFSDIGDFDGDGFFDTISFTGGTTTTNPFSFLAGDNATADAATDAYAQLGHGGRLATGTNTGDISVDAERTIRFEAGALGARTYAQLGHGGHDAAPVIGGMNPIGLANSGNISVESRTGAVNLLWGATNTDASDQSYVQLGHGGFLSDPTVSGVDAGGNNSGNISVKAGTSLLLRSTTSAVPSVSNFVQIGHGGMGWVGNHSGDISTMAGTTVTATAGGGSDRYAQIGHGGTNAFGDHSGDIAVLADGNITFTGTGAAVRGYTQIGHGGHNADSLLGHSGDIGVASLGGDLVFTAAGGAQTESYTQLGHGGFDAAGAHNGNIVARAGDDITFTASGGSGGTGSFSGYAQLGHGGMKATGSSDLAANLSGDIAVSSHVEGMFNDIGDFGDLSFVDGGGTGGLRFIGGQGTTGPVGADNYSQLGHGGRLNRGVHSGDIQVDSNKQILFQAGRTGSRTYVQLGHGGHDSAVLGSGPGTMGNSGSITVNATENIDFRWGATNSTTSAETYAQLGHGGYLTDPAVVGAAGGDNSGAISVTANNILFRGTTGSTSGGNYLQLGHGGMRWTGHHSGEITVDASGFEAGDPTRSIAFIAGSGGADRYAQLGHGGRLARGNHGLVDVSGAAIETIRVTGLNDIVFSGGTSSRNYAMIGNGGHDADLASAPRGAAANVEVRSSSGSVLFTGGTGDSAYAQIGNGGYATSGSHRGDVSVTADQNVVFQAAQAGGTANAYVQIGNGGRDAVGGHSGDLSVTATNGNIEFTSGAANDRYAQLGHGGRGARGNHSGDVDVTAGGNVTFASYSAGPSPSTTTNNSTLNNLLQNDTAANYTMAQTANIDRSTIVITYDNPLPGFSGTITGNATGQLFDGSTQVGTVSAGGVVNLSVTVSDSTAGPANSVITFDHINLGQRSYAQLGHGGYDADPTTALGNTGDISVTSQNGTVDFTAGSRNETFAQLGHGGSLTIGNHGGDISVQALGTSGSINFTGGTFTTTYAQLGHGGNDADGNFTGDISLGTTGDVNLSGREGTDGFAHVGHGGHNSDGTASGDISVVADGAVRLDGGSGARSYAQIGHGGQNGMGNRSGEMRIAAADLTVTGGTQAEAYALVGHGGVANGFLPANNNYTTGTRTGSLWVDIAGTTTLADQTSIGFMGHLGTGGTTVGSGLQLLTGQLDTTTSLRGVSGMIHTMAAGGVGIGVTNGDLLVNGTGASGNSLFDIDLLATGDVLFDSAVQNAGSGDVRVVAGWDGTTGVVYDALAPYPTFAVSGVDVVDDPTLYGIGGAVVEVGTAAQTRNVAVGSANGTTHIVGEGINVLGSTASSYGAAQIGFNEEIHRVLGGGNAAGATGDIIVHTKEGGLTLQGGSMVSTSAQIGHGGQDTTAVFGGDIHIDLGKGSAVADLVVRAGSGLDAYAQIGHGGRRSQGTKSGNLLVNAADIDLRSGASAYTSARIGHGGGQAGGNIVGVIDIDAEGNVIVAGGSASFAPAQIGHGGFAYFGNTTASPVYLDVAGDLTLEGGSSNQSAAQVGHGGPLYNGDISGGDLTVTVGNDISVSGGIGVGGYGQIGFGGVASHGDRSGGLQVSAGNDIALGTAFGTSASYVKIGHGDDLDPALAGLGGVGDWSGDIEVGAGRNITLFNAMIGHSNAVSKGTTTGGVTQIGASRNDPTDPTGGNLIADRTSEFAGEDELRFYLPRRANNQIAAGAMINGAAYAGARVDPSNVQGIDEYTINIIGDQILFPNEHGNQFGTGPTPANPGGFAFYYDTIEIVAPIAVLPDGPENQGPDKDDTDPDSDFFLEDFSSLVPDDEMTDDNQRKRKKFFRAYNPFSILYEGYDHYGPNGESTFEYQPTEELGNFLDEVPLAESSDEVTVGDVAPGA